MNWTPPPQRSRRISSFLICDVILVLLSIALLKVHMDRKDTEALAAEPAVESTEVEKVDSDPVVDAATAEGACPTLECPVVECPDSSADPGECTVPDTTSETMNSEEQKASRKAMDESVDRFEIALAKHIRKKRIEVVRSPKGIILRMPIKRAFQSNKPRFRKSYAKVMRVVRRLLADSSLPIIISCHTDDESPPGSHRSNWTYSSSCAGHVARSVLRKDMIVSDRVEVRAFAHTKPMVPNTTKRGRQQNRRIEIELVFRP